MRFGILIGAFGAACLATSASAQTHAYTIDVSAYVTGLQSVYDPNQIGCNGGPPGSIFCTGVGPYSEQIATTIVLFGTTPTGHFEWGNSRTGLGAWSGDIIGSVQYGLTGLNLAFGRDQAGGPFFQNGYAPTFSATLRLIDGQAAPAPVPEPATWALLVLGFAGAGALLRRRVNGELASA